MDLQRCVVKNAFDKYASVSFQLFCYKYNHDGAVRNTYVTTILVSYCNRAYANTL